MTTPLVLGFDTSAAHCAAALLRGEDIIASCAEEMSRGQAERLMVLIEEHLASQGVTRQDISEIGVGVGTGKFTGIRISVAAARGLALALDIPAVGVSTFEATSYGQTSPHIATVPAPREQVYALDTTPDAAPPLTPRLTGANLDTNLPILLPPPPAQLAENIGRIAALRRHLPQASPAPLYIRAADAAPARDLPPLIL